MTVIFIVAGLFLLCALAIGGRAVHPLRWRRAGLAVAFLLFAVSALIMADGGIFPWPRSVVIVCGKDKESLNDARTIAQSLRPYDRVSFATLAIDKQAADVPEIDPEALTWRTVGLQSWWRQGNGSASQVTADAIPILAPPHRWDCLFRLIEFHSNFSRPTLIVAYNNGPTWSQCNLDSNFATRLRTAVSDLDRFNADAFLYFGPGSERRSGLSARLSRSPLPPCLPVDLGPTSIELFLNDADIRAPGREYNISIGLDDIAPKLVTEKPVVEPTDKQGRDSHWLTSRYLRNDLPVLYEGELEPGFHLLRFYVDVVDQHIRYECTTYFEVSARKVGLVGTHGDLAREGWRPYFSRPDDVPRPAQLLNEWLTSKDEPYRRIGSGEGRRTELISSQIWEMGNPSSPQSDSARFIQELNQSCALVLVEPTWGDVQQIGEWLKAPSAGPPLIERIRDGLILGVIGPPRLPQPVPNNVPKWLSTVRKDDSHQFNDVRIYFAFDQSPHIHLHDEGESTASEFQSGVANELCKRLNTRSDILGVEAAPVLISEVSDGRVVARTQKPLYGRIPGTIIQARMMPPILATSGDSSGRPAAHAVSARDGVIWEMFPGWIPLRLGLLYGFGATATLNTDDFYGDAHELLDDRGQYGNTHIVVFATSGFRYPAGCPSGLELKVETQKKSATPYPCELAVAKSIADLAAQGIFVHLVLIDGFEAMDDFGDTTRNAFNRDLLDTEAKTPDQELSMATGLPVELRSPYRGIPSAVADRILTFIKANARAGDTVARVRAERVVDVRSIPEASSPQVHVSLQSSAAGNEFARYMRFRGASPAIVVEKVGHGAIVSFSFSPFAADLWRTDAALSTLPHPRMRPFSVDQIASLRQRNLLTSKHEQWLAELGLEPPEVAQVLGEPKNDNHGWGLQRILDVVELTALSRTVSSQSPKIHTMTLSDDGRSLQIGLDADLTSTGYSDPLLLVNGKPEAAVNLDIVESDVVSQRMTLLVTAKQDIKSASFGTHAVQLADATVDGSHRIPVFFDLRSVGTGAADVRDALLQYCAMFGGHSIGQEHLTAGLASQWPVLPFAASLVCIGCILAFFPLRELKRWLAAQRTKAKGSELVVKRYAFDVDAVLKEWGTNSGVPQANRATGLPAGRKSFEPGDNLGVARIADMLAYTAAGRALGIPRKKPIVRLKRSSRALAARLVCDCSPSLRFPLRNGKPSKPELLEFVARIIIGAVWQASGVVSMSILQQPDFEWGPFGAGADVEDAIASIDKAIATTKGRTSVSSLNWTPGEIVFVLSDGMNILPKRLYEWGSDAIAENVHLRFVLLYDPLSRHELGICQSSISETLLDRRDWEPQDMDLALRERQNEIRHSLISSDARYAEVSVEDDVAALFATLTADGILE
jgi:hypothetical protein